MIHRMPFLIIFLCQMAMIGFSFQLIAESERPGMHAACIAVNFLCGYFSIRDFFKA